MYIDKYIVILCILYIYIFYAFSCFRSSLLLYPIEFLVSLNFEFHWFIAIVLFNQLFSRFVCSVYRSDIYYTVLALTNFVFQWFQQSSRVIGINCVRKLFISMKEEKKFILYDNLYAVLCDLCSKRLVRFVFKETCVICV